LQGLKAMETYDGDNVLSMLDRQGVDASVHMASHDDRLRGRMRAVLADRQRRSFLPGVKVELLQRRLDGVEGG